MKRNEYYPTRMKIMIQLSGQSCHWISSEILDDEDFGDFEVPSNPNEPQSPNKSIVISSLKPEKLRPIIYKNLVTEETPSKILTDSTPSEDDEWGDFAEDFNDFSIHPSGSTSNEDNKMAILRPSESPVGIIRSIDPLQVGPIPSKSPLSNISEGKIVVCQNPPPSTIPPPSILLVLITTLFQSLNTDLKKIVLFIEPSANSQTQTPIDQSSVTELSTHLAVIRAAARIIAGRKLRWRRDSHLSQNMKIGPAHAGKAGGMKLTGIDRTENRREDREAEEAVRIWKQQLGSSRAIIAAINHRQQSLNLAVPEILEIMPVRQAKLSDGAISAPVCCFLCGIKRDERVEKIDTDVEDSFGEWWVDHWGHMDCVIFWKKQESALQQRR